MASSSSSGISREQPLPADHHVDAIDDASNTEPSEIGEVHCRRQFADLVPRAGRDRLGNRMFGRTPRAHLRVAAPRPGCSPSAVITSTRVIVPVVTVPVLSSTMVSTRSGGLQHLRTLDQDAQLRTPARTDHQRRRRREAQRARARDDQHRHRRREGRRDRSARADPEPQRRHGQRDDDRHEDAGDPVRQPLGLRLPVLGILDQPAICASCGVGADPGRPHHESAVDVDGRTDHVGHPVRLPPAPTRRSASTRRPLNCPRRPRHRWRSSRPGAPRTRRRRSADRSECVAPHRFSAP